MKIILRFCCLITGDDYQMLKDDTSASRKKTVLLGISVLIPVMVWFICGYMLSAVILKNPESIAILAAIFCALIVFVIEKSVITVNGNKLILYYRVCLAILVSVIGATIIDEVIFKNDIDQQLELMQRVETEQELAKHDSLWNQRLIRQDSNVRIAYANWDSSMRRIQFEVTGVKGTGVKGYGAVTKAMVESADKYLRVYENESAKLDSARVDSDRERIIQQEKINSSYNDNSLLKRIKAMFQLVFSDIFMAAFYFLFTVFFIFLECMPIMIKFVSSRTNYERRIELEEEIGERRMKRISDISKGMNFNEPDMSRTITNHFSYLKPERR